MIDPNSSRTIRQKEAIEKWIAARCCGTGIYPTGFGKTTTAIGCIKRFLNKNPTKKILVVVPTDVLKVQWTKILDYNGLSFNAEVQIINSVIRQEQYFDMLVLDEIHRYSSNTFSEIFKKIKYGMILGLTATYERLDGKEKILDQYCPPFDCITLKEAVLNGWLSQSNIYKVIINVDDIEKYKELNKQFISHFSFFDFDWNRAMGCVTSYQNRVNYVKELIGNNNELFKEKLTECTTRAFAWNKALQHRKEFVNNHPKKLEIANKILDARPNSKSIVFHSNIKQCETFNRGYIVHSGKNKKENKQILEEFNTSPKGSIINSSKMLTEGLDVKGLDLAIILHNSSSSTERIQKMGRVLRLEENKKAEIFSILIRDTVEEQWFKKSAKNTEFIELNEYELDYVLKNYKINKQPVLQKEERYIITY